nr:MAG TPA_asm: Protein of unknown function (DUF3914) [Caudoviricetes sp.]
MKSVRGNVSLALFSSFDYWDTMKHKGVPLLPIKETGR